MGIFRMLTLIDSKQSDTYQQSLHGHILNTWQTQLRTAGLETSNMVTSCVAYNCTNRQKKGSSISFHRFPDVKKMPEHRAAWIQAIRRKDWTPTSNSFLCSEHFEENCFVVRPNKIGRRLNDWAVPSIFNFPSHRQSKQQKFRKSKKQFAEATVGSSTVEDQDVPSHAKVTRRSTVEGQDVPSHAKVTRRSAVEGQDVPSHAKVTRRSAVEGQDVPSHAKVTRRSTVEDQDVPSHAKVARRSAVEDQDVPSHAKVTRRSAVEDQDVPSHAKVTRHSAVEDQDVPSHAKVTRRSAVEDQDVPSHAKVTRHSAVEDQDVPSHAKVTRHSAVEDQDVPNHAKVARSSVMEDQDVPSHAKVARSSVIEVQDGSSHAKVAKQLDQEESRIARKHPAESSVGCSVVVDEGVPSLAKVARRLCTEHSYVSQSQPVPPKIIKKTAELKKKIKALNQKLRRKQQRINRLTYLVKSIGDQRLLIEGSLNVRPKIRMSSRYMSSVWKFWSPSTLSINRMNVAGAFLSTGGVPMGP
ncbi:hypothetical protein LSAT2_028319 [Lamellibrachia satsuma]|nr:hypothetical protein LSAT2_028319 [Lamellibrachia satsuma]